jgi:EmrB/QacA subfamily drug resistance transporter
MAPESSTADISALPPITRTRSVAILGGLFLAILIGALDEFIVVTALPRIVTDLSQPTGAAFVISAYLISATVGIPVFGRLADGFSRRAVFLLGLATFTLGSVLSGLSQSFDQLVAFRAIQGFSSGAFIIIAFSILSVLYSPEARARITGVFAGTFVIATVAGPLIGSYIVDVTAWRWIFYINIPIIVLSVAMLLPAIGALKPAARGSFDSVGTGLLFGWVAPLMFALVQNSDAGWAWSDSRIIALLAAFVVVFGAFIARELRTSHPIVPLRLFSSGVFAANGVQTFFRGIALSSVPAFLAIYVGLILLQGGPSSSDTVRDVLYFLVIPAAPGAGIGSQLLTRTSYRRIATAGFALAAIGTYALTQISASTPVWQFAYGFIPTGGIVLTLPLVGFGLGLTIPVSVLSAQFSVAKEQIGSATAVAQFIAILGGAVGLSLLSSFFQWRLSALTPDPPASPCVPGGSLSSQCVGYFHSVQNAGATATQEVFLVVLVLIAVGFFASVLIKGRMPVGAHMEAA